MKCAASLLKFFKIILLCLAATGANYFLNTFVEKTLKLPLFLDTLFTVAVTFIAGPLAGIFTAVMTTLSFGITRYEFWGTYLFVLCSIAAVLLAWAFRKKHSFEFSSGKEEQASPFSIMAPLLMLSVLMCFVISILGGIIGTFITAIIRYPEYDYSPEIYFKLGLLRQNLSVLAANILARIPVNIVDRTITVFGAYGVTLLLKKILKIKLANSSAKTAIKKS